MADVTPSLKKIEKAETKLANLIEIASDWINSSPYTYYTKIHGNIANEIGRINKPIPNVISWEMVELVGHLRDALDKALVAVVHANGRGVSGVGFPFGGIDNNTREPLEFPTERTTKHLKKKLTFAQWNFIIANEPHPRGNKLLWGINEIANQDKHRKGLAEVACSPQTTFHIRGGIVTHGISAHVGSVEYKREIGLNQETEILFAAYPSSLLFTAQINRTYASEIVFGDIPEVAGKEIMATLHAQCGLVRTIVDALATLI